MLFLPQQPFGVVVLKPDAVGEFEPLPPFGCVKAAEAGGEISGRDSVDVMPALRLPQDAAQPPAVLLDPLIHAEGYPSAAATPGRDQQPPAIPSRNHLHIRGPVLQEGGVDIIDQSPALLWLVQ